MLMDAGTVLVVVAHPDDEVLGCGGTIARLTQNGQRVVVMVCADGVSSRPDDANEPAAEARWAQARAAAHLLGAEIYRADTPTTHYVFPDNAADVVSRLRIGRVLSHVMRHFGARVVLTHSSADLNVDHRRVHEAVRVAARPTIDQPVRAIYAFEIPSSTAWGLRPFAPALWVNVTATLSVKLEAMRLYEREQEPWPHPRSERALEALAALRGADAGLHAAEAFEIVRVVY
jgi:LmbE family N-acetylglucosaminyl deacetylase